ncbi:regucalcin [Anabrus simplex]|uniref:regucalcin n=1 Tax=Anabrus simplex TaxID=316456 RepID=UPI0035A2F535
MAAPRVESISSRAIVGEGPHWDEKEQALYTVDIRGSQVRKYCPSTKKETFVQIEGATVSFVVPLKDQKGKFILGLGRSFAILTWDGVSNTPSHIEWIATVDDEDEEKAGNRLNDGKADPSGRLWAGTMGPINGPLSSIPPTASLFSLSKERKVTVHLTSIAVGNGLTWSLDHKVMYYIDSVTDKIDAFDFDVHHGKIFNRRTVFDFATNQVKGHPDGMTIDTEGMLWIACFEGNQIIRINPESGKRLKTIPIPAFKVTSLAFGGANLDELYVTTASVGMSKTELEAMPGSGCIFRVTGTGAKGFAGQAAVLEEGVRDL